MRRILGLVLAAFLIGSWGQAIAEDAVTNDRMPPDRFWELVGATTKYEADPGAQLKALRSVLTGLTPQDVVSFELAFGHEMQRAYTWDLWGAAYVLLGGASDDSFVYFRRWLISKGRRVFEAAVQSPDDLADLLASNAQGIAEFEGFAYGAAAVWSEKTGKDAFEPESGYSFYGSSLQLEPSGKPFEEDSNHLSLRYPKLWKRFGEKPFGFE